MTKRFTNRLGKKSPRLERSVNMQNSGTFQLPGIWMEHKEYSWKRFEQSWKVRLEPGCLERKTVAWVKSLWKEKGWFEFCFGQRHIKHAVHKGRLVQVCAFIFITSVKARNKTEVRRLGKWLTTPKLLSNIDHQAVSRTRSKILWKALMWRVKWAQVLESEQLSS